MISPATKIDRYISRIHNTGEKEYALAYLRFICGFSETEPDKGSLTSMGAQSVRLELHRLTKEA